MLVQFTEISIHSDLLAEVKAIYLASFPKEEQHPFDWLVEMARLGKGHFGGLIQENRVLGITYYTVDAGIVYIFYFAVDPAIRSQGYGHQMMQAMQEKYQGCKFMLLIEEILEDVENKEERIRRKIFYQKNGFEGTDDFVEVLGATFELLHLKSGHSSMEDYRQIKSNFYSDVS